MKGKQVCAEYISGAVWGMLQAASLSNNVRCQKSFQFVVNINHSGFHCMLNIPVFINSRFMSFVMICILHETSPHLLMKASASRLVHFLLEPLLAIINNKQVEPISSASSSSCLQSDWMAWPWGGCGGGTMLQHLERRVEGWGWVAFGGIRYQGTQLYLENVVAISNCHLLRRIR